MRAVKTLLIGLFSTLAFAAGKPVLAKSPVVVELFTSQGCSSCLDANGIIQDLNDTPGVIGLTFAVDYWDYLGWRDTFGQPQFTARQKAYMKRLGAGEIYTPQVVIGGDAQTAGLKRDKVDRLIRNAKNTNRASPTLRIASSGRLAIGFGRPPKGGAEVWLVRYDPGQQSVEVKRGENRGKAVTYSHVVHDVTRLGGWRGQSKTLGLPTTEDDGLERLVLVQGTKGGRIIAALKLKTAKPGKSF